MLTRFWILFASLLLVAGIFFSVHEKKHSKSTIRASNEIKSFVSFVPIRHFSSTKAPLIEILVHGKPYLTMLDLGLRGDLAFSEDLIKEIEPKTFLETMTMHNIKGMSYETPLFEVPYIKIGDLTFTNPIIQEKCNHSFHETSIRKDGLQSSIENPVRVGWELFFNSNLLIDIGNQSIAFADSLETLEYNGYPVDGFIEAPLHIDRGLVEVDILLNETTSLRCMLDTGATLNVIHRELFEGKTFHDALFDPTNQEQFDSCQIGGKEFGPISFRRLPIRLPTQIDAILGMEFFRENLVFLDFANRKAYFMRNSSDNRALITDESNNPVGF